METNTKILRPNPLKTIIFILVSILFVIAGTFSLEDNSWKDWAGIVFFGFGCIVFTIILLPNSTYLKLTEEGFEMKTLFRSHFTRWDEVQSFSVSSIPIFIIGEYGWFRWFRSRKIVVFDYVKGHKKQGFLKSINQYISGGQAGFPDTYGLAPKALAELLNEWKQKYG